MKRNDTREDQRCSLTGPIVPVLVMTDDQAQPVPDPGSPSLHMNIFTGRNQHPLRPIIPCAFTPDTLSQVTQ